MKISSSKDLKNFGKRIPKTKKHFDLINRRCLVFNDKLHIGDSFSVYDNTNSKFVYTINEFLEEELDNTFFTFDVSLYPDIEVIDFR